MPASRLNRFPIWFFPALVLLAVTAGLLWLTPADPARAQAGQTVPADWPLIPDGIEPGDSFRLLFVTSATTNTASSNIADYNAHAQGAAGGSGSLKSFKGEFTALVSTSSVDARDNTGTTGTGVPIHWLGGEKVADDYTDLYDGDWDSVSGQTEGGASYAGLVWTGGNKAGQKSGQRYAGAAEVRLGDLSDATTPLSSPTVKASGEAYPLYALSPVITVAQPEPEPEPTPTPTPEPADDPPAITSGPIIGSSPSAGDTYGKGETIEVAVTFSEAVTVAGEPRVRLSVGERGRRARYDRSESNGATLIFAYTVKGNDLDGDGVSIEANQLLLNGGTIADADPPQADANLEHPALPDQAGHQVNGAPEEAPAEGEGQRQRAANRAPQFAADTATRSVDENSAAGTNVGDPIAATDADGDALTYALSGSDAFAIDAATGQIAVSSDLDYETQSGYFLTVTVSDGKNADGETDAGVDDAIAVTVSIGNVDEPGVVSLVSDADPARVGSELRAVLLDPDGVVEGSTAWQWKRSPDGTTAQNVNATNFDDIAGGTEATMLLTAADAGRWLRAKATYADAFGAGKRARAQTANPVASPPGSSPQSQNAPAQPTGFRTTGGDGEVTLIWNDQSSDTTITKWQYQYGLIRVLTGSPAISWTDIPGSNNATTSFTVTGLDNWTEYWFRIRPVAGNDPGSQTNTTVDVPVGSVIPGEQSVLPSWRYKPRGLVAGDRFRVLFVTDAATSATSTDISDYNAFVQKEADKNFSLVNRHGAKFSNEFRALVTTEAVAAKDNTLTTAPSVPIYWLGGEKVADGYADFYDGSWDSYAGKTGSGKDYTGDVWTGSGNDGYASRGGVDQAGSSPAVVYGVLSRSRAFTHATENNANQNPLYALSPVLEVGRYPDNAPAEPTGLTTTGADGEVTLSWDDQSSDTTITKWQYGYGLMRELTGSLYTSWIDIPGSGNATTSFTMTGLDNWTEYWFRIRAVAGTAIGRETDRTPGVPVKSVIPGDESVAPNWGYKPAGLETGDKFRVLFLTDAVTSATSTDIADYNAFVQEEADKNFSLVNRYGAKFSSEFRALVSTEAVTAKDNTLTTAPSVPIYWLGGEKVADGYADFYDGSWDSYAGKTGSGKDYAGGGIWTGSADTGYLPDSGRIGQSEVWHGNLSNSDPFTDATENSANSKFLYALSPVLEVGRPSYRYSGTQPDPTTGLGRFAHAYDGPGKDAKRLSPRVYTWRQLGVAEEGKDGTLTASTDPITPEVGHLDADGYRYVYAPKVNRFPDGVTGKKWRAVLFRFPTAGLTEAQKDDLEWLLLRTFSFSQTWYTGGERGTFVWPAGSDLSWEEIVKRGIEEKNLRSVPDFEVDWFSCTSATGGNYAITGTTTLHREIEKFD